MNTKDLGENGGLISSLVTIAPGLRRSTAIKGISYSESFPGMRSLLSFLWSAPVNGDYLISVWDGRKITIVGKDFVTDYIPDSSAAVFRLVNDADFILDDEDGLWFTGGVQNDVTVTNLIGQDYTRTLVLYDNDTPYHIRGIGLIRSGIVVTPALKEDIARDFDLWLLWNEEKN